MRGTCTQIKKHIRFKVKIFLDWGYLAPDRNKCRGINISVINSIEVRESYRQQ